jgi:DNA-directed RNA polymerase specialized sigma24 family protein
LTTPDEMDERVLVEAAQTEPARFLDLYDRHFHRVYAYVLRRTGNRAESEDGDRRPPGQPRVIEMRFGDGKSIQETAAVLCRSEGAVKQLQRRALENLRANLEEPHG